MSRFVFLAHAIEWQHAADRVHLRNPRAKGENFRRLRAAEFDPHAATELAELIELTARRASIQQQGEDNMGKPEDKGLREEVAAQSIPEVWSAGTARLASGWRDGESRALAIAVMALRSIESQEPDTHELTLAHMMAQSAREALTLIQEVMEP